MACTSALARELGAGVVYFDFRLVTGRGVVSCIFVMKEVTRYRLVFGKADESESRHSGHADVNRGQSTGQASFDTVRTHVLLLAFWAADLNAGVQLDRKLVRHQRHQAQKIPCDELPCARANSATIFSVTISKHGQEQIWTNGTEKRGYPSSSKNVWWARSWPLEFPRRSLMWPSFSSLISVARCCRAAQRCRFASCCHVRELQPSRPCCCC